MVPDHEHDPFIEGIAAELRRPVRFDSGFDARVMEALDPAVLPMRRRPRPRTPWLLRPRTISVTPLGGLAVAATLAGIIALGVWRSGMVATPTIDAADSQVAEAPAQSPVFTPVANVADEPAEAALVGVPFIITLPSAKAVSIVGDFNDWDPSKTPLTRVGDNGVWSVRLLLPPGRHRYQFVMDGATWMSDPAATQAEDDGFGTANSVVIVKGDGQ